MKIPQTVLRQALSFMKRSSFQYVITFVAFQLTLTCLEVTLDEKPAIAFTYHDIWWLGESPAAPADQSPAVLQVYYTYPDTVYAGQVFNVGITLEYIKDDRALLDWVVFSRVAVSLKNYSSLLDHFSRDEEGKYPTDLDYVSDDISRIVSPGERYSYSFNITAPQTPGEYVIFPQWDVFYGPGTTIQNSFRWNLKSYYNQTDRDFGTIYPDEIPPIKVIEQNEIDSSADASLSIFINSPYRDINPIEATISRFENSDFEYSKFIESNGYARFDLRINTTYVITVPKIIDIIPNKIRAVFVNWTDGHISGSQINEMAENITRIVDLKHDLEIVPMYKTQYYLLVKSEDGINTYDNNGTGWYDSGDQARFAANTFGTITSLYSFDHWNGTVLTPGESPGTGSSGVITMNGPNEISAVWKFDYGYLGAYLGIITGGLTLFGIVRSHFYAKLWPVLSRKFGNLSKQLHGK